MLFNIRDFFKISFFIFLFCISNPLWALTNATGEEITLIEDASDCNQNNYDEISTIICINDKTYDFTSATYIEPNTTNINKPVHTLEEAPKSIWPRIKNKYALHDAPTKAAIKSVEKYENWYKDRPEYVDRMLKRSEKYLFYVTQQVELRGMPSEIALLPMIESAYNPIANSVMKANGLWQFIPSTGRLYGLKQDWWKDDRRNVIESTNAALNYLEKLYADFGTWELALAAYNAGEGRVGRAIKKNNRQNKPTDYYSLTLPNETKNYVPKLLAIKNIMSSPEKYDLYIADIPDQPYFDSITIPNEIDTELIAEFAEITMEEFQFLNAQHKRPLLKSDNDIHKVLLPINSIEIFHRNMAAYEKPLVSWHAYKPKAGEKIQQVAKKFGVDIKLLATVNQINYKKKFEGNSTILIPSNDALKTTFPVSDNNLFNYSSIITHHVSPGETLTHIADAYKISVKKLMEFNELKSSKIISGSTLDIPK